MTDYIIPSRKVELNSTPFEVSNGLIEKLYEIVHHWTNSRIIKSGCGT